MKRVSEMLTEEWSSDAVRVHYVSDWYTSTAFDEWLIERGETKETIGTHAGLLDTALLLAVAPEHVRTDNMSVGKGFDIDGVTGDPTGATAEIGQVGMDFYFDAAMQQIRTLMADD
jgi:creatinine amidohydrolase